jgi:phosphonate transport system substrate-binding protein
MEAIEEQATKKPRRFGAQFFVTVVLILIAAFAGWKVARVVQVQQPLEESKNENRQMQLGLTGSDLPDSAGKLADTFTDANGDMIADPPTDPKKFVDPPTLYFSYVANEDPEKYKEQWKPFCDHLSKVTGKPVEYVEVTTSIEQLQALADGKLHVTGLNTGSVPTAVNTCGFVPVCRVPTNEPAGTHVEIIVPASSSITKLEDLKTQNTPHELTMTEPNSNSGYKAPIVLLKSEFGLEPERDYLMKFSLSHDHSIEGIAKGEYQAAAVSADMLARAEATGAINKSQYRSIYKSESFPSAALGYAYNLDPKLADKVKEALLTFDVKGTPLESDFGAGDQTKFVPVKYKDDWALIRRIDDESARLRAAN